MRAKLAVALAALGIVASTVPSLAMNNTISRVQRILWGDQAVSLVLTQPAVVANTAIVTNTAVVANGATVVSAPILSDNTIIREIPAVLAPTSTGMAIISQIPSDLDIRREDLGRKIDEALGLNRIGSGEATELKTALALIGTREVQFRSDGYLSPKESKTLFRAMDKVGSDLDWYAGSNNRFLGMRTY